MNYKLVYARRKTISLQINQNGEIVVRAPRCVSQKYIDQFILSKGVWITKSLEKVSARSPKPKEFVEGELFLYIGTTYPLRILEGYRRRIELSEAFYISKFFAPKAKNLFEVWYKDQAKLLFQQRATYFAQIMNVNFKKVTIRTASTRWGSCSSLGNINFTWRLIMAPLSIIDYVVVHELAHIRHKNHSVTFWKFVEQHCPDYKSARKWLNVNGNTLKI